MSFDENDDDERAALAAEARASRRYHRQLLLHPHPADPDHPEPLDRQDE